MDGDQGRLFPLEHVSTYPERRRTNISEEVYASEWENANKIEPWRYRGLCLLEAILSRYDGPPVIATQRDAMVAASVIQWLGTNCGLGFIKECERKIEEARKQEIIAERLKNSA